MRIHFIKIETGDKCNMLTYIRDLNKSEYIGKTKHTYGLAECECGNIKRVQKCKFYHKHLKSCGCKCKSYKSFLDQKRNDINYPYYIILGTIKHRAGQSNIEVNLSIEYLKEIWKNQEGLCVYSHIELKLPTGWNDTREDVVSVDRINSSIGYVESNIQFVYKKINLMKYTMSHEEFIKLCKLIALNN